MSRIEAAFQSLRRQRRTALLAYLPVGYPDLQATLELVPALVGGGADLIELGIPFSDPLADGATIQRATFQALQQGVTVADCLSAAQRLRETLDAPLLFMGYYNPILNYGLEAFCRAAAEAGADGLIIPDLPPEEAGELRTSAKARGLDLVFLLAPTSTPERIAAVAEAASGFIYCVALAGVTGARAQLDAGLAAFIGRVRRQAKGLPLAVGFGISKPQHFATLAGLADGVVVGSALIDQLEALPQAERARGIQRYLRWLRGEEEKAAQR